MAKANKKSLEAKAYINGKVNDMREQFHKASDEETRKQLVENFGETTSSEEYKKKLNVVNEDVAIIRKDAKRKKWWDVTTEEFKDAKTEFYGKDMDLEFWEDFEKLDLWKKVDYIFERFWDTDYAADLIIKILKPLKYWPNWEERLYLEKMAEMYANGNKTHILNWLTKCFWNGVVTIRLYFDLADHTYNRFKAWDLHEWTQGLGLDGDYSNITQDTLKKISKTRLFKQNIIDNHQPWNSIHGWGLAYIVMWCEDWSISDLWLIENLKKVIADNMCETIQKLSVEWQKFIINYAMEIYKNHINCLPNIENLKWVLNLCEWISDDVIMDAMINNLTDRDIDRCFKYVLPYKSRNHKTVMDFFIKAWKIELVKKYINNFTWLTDEERDEIMRMI